MVASDTIEIEITDDMIRAGIAAAQDHMRNGGPCCAEHFVAEIIAAGMAQWFHQGPQVPPCNGGRLH